MDENTSTDTLLQFERDEDFASLYANNVTYEAAIWDLKMIFGQLDQSGKVTIRQHTAITMPWMQAKLMVYLLQINIASFESEHGKIKIPDRLLPPEPESLAGFPASDDNVQLKAFKKIRDEFLASLK